MDYIEPTPRSRRNIATVFVVSVGLVALYSVFRDDLLAGFDRKMAQLSRCELVTVFRWMGLTAIALPALMVAWIAWTATKALRLGQFPLPGAWVLKRTPIRRGRIVRVGAYAVLILCAIFAAWTLRLGYLLETRAEQMEGRNCAAEASTLPRR